VGPVIADGRPIVEWSVEEVCAWMTGLGGVYHTYAPALREGGIDGAALIGMFDSVGARRVLEELGVRSALHITRIMTDLQRRRDSGQ
jgi:hypothetical protein